MEYCGMWQGKIWGDEEMMDMRFETHQKHCKGFVETKVSFRRNGRLEQVEEYYDIKEATGFPAD